MHRTTTTKTEKLSDVMATVKGPKKSTISLLKQFARVYSYNAELPRGLEAMVLNWQERTLHPLGRKSKAFSPLRQEALLFVGRGLKVLFGRFRFVFGPTVV